MVRRGPLTPVRTQPEILVSLDKRFSSLKTFLFENPQTVSNFPRIENCRLDLQDIRIFDSLKIKHYSDAFITFQLFDLCVCYDIINIHTIMTKPLKNDDTMI